MALAVTLGTGPAAHTWPPAQPGYVWSFLRDHWAREGYKTEWRYFTGHLRTAEESVRRFGYQFTFVRIGVSQDALRSGSAWAAKDSIMGHAVLTDLDPDRHRFSELMVRASLLLAGFGRHPDPRLGWCVGPPGTPEPWDFRWNRGDFDFNMGDPREVLRIQPVHGSSQARGVPAPRRPEPERGGAIAVAPVKRHDRASKRVSL